MAYPTRTQLVAEIITYMGLTAGSSVQLYDEPKVEQGIQQTFDWLFDKKCWDHLSNWYTWTLDGTTGIVTTDLTAIVRSWEHIQEMYVGDTDRAIVLPQSREHLRVTGSYPIYYKPLVSSHANFLDGVFACYPIDATGDIDVYTKVKPADFDNDSLIPFPKNIMTFGTAWRLLASDGVNQDAADTAQRMFDEVFNEYTANIEGRPKGHGGQRSSNQVVIGALL